MWRQLARLIILAALTSALGWASLAFAETRRPLLIEGKRLLYQRVLTRPGAVLRSAAQDGAAAAIDHLKPFDPFYVYARQGEGEVGWLEVGRTPDGTTQGWLKARDVIDWKQTIVVAFGNPAGRERTLLFDTRQNLVDLLESENMVPRAQELRRKAVQGPFPVEGGVVSIEPDTYIDITKKFYLLPILDVEKSYLESGFETELLRVASVPLDANPLQQQGPREERLKQFNVGVVFLVDTTLSMGPYIDRTREAVQRIYERIKGSPIGSRVSYGIVGFRDDPDLVKRLDYLTRTFVPLKPGRQPQQVLDGLKQVTESKVSSRGFDEDSLAGVLEAMNDTDWKPFDGKYIILVTDAGPRKPDDPYGTAKIKPADLNSQLRERGIALFALHLLTPAGKFDHDYAADQYKALAKFGDTTLYEPVPGGSVEAFGKSVDTLSDSLIGQVTNAMAGHTTRPQVNADATGIAAASQVGLAMQLAYLGRREGTQAPPVFEAWLTDRNLERPQDSVLEVRLLVTKNQLSNSEGRDQVASRRVRGQPRCPRGPEHAVQPAAQRRGGDGARPGQGGRRAVQDAGRRPGRISRGPALSKRGDGARRGGLGADGRCAPARDRRRAQVEAAALPGIPQQPVAMGGAVAGSASWRDGLRDAARRAALSAGDAHVAWRRQAPHRPRSRVRAAHRDTAAPTRHDAGADRPQRLRQEHGSRPLRPRTAARRGRSAAARRRRRRFRHRRHVAQRPARGAGAAARALFRLRAADRCLAALSHRRRQHSAGPAARRPADPTRVDDLARHLGIAELKRELPERLSVGQRQRVAIARALAHAPDFVIADEPTASLDPDNARLVMELLVSSTREAGGALLVVAHDLDLVAELALPRATLATEALPQGWRTVLGAPA